MLMRSGLPVLSSQTDKPREYCGVMAVYDPQGLAARFVHRGLVALQHRGQEAAGLAIVTELGSLHAIRGAGLVRQVLKPSVVASLSATRAIGHVRYSTVAEEHPDNHQPICADTPFGPLSLAHNGHLRNAKELTAALVAAGVTLCSTMDSELFVALVARSRASSFAAALKDATESVVGSYSLAMCCDGRIYGLRDPHGLRPLVIGVLAGSPSGFVIASETCALDALGAQFVCEVGRGELVEVGPQGIVKTQLLAPSPAPAPCMFELIYFARPDSVVFGIGAQRARIEMGRELALQDRDLPMPDLVVPIPDSGVAAATGYAQTSGVPFEMALLRSHFAGRSFILPNQDARRQALLSKLSVVAESVAGKRIVLVDDSLVRGNTARFVSELLRERGAKEVWLRLASPPIVSPCHLGIDMASPDELLFHVCQESAQRTTPPQDPIDVLRQQIGVDGVRFLSQAGLRRATQQQPFCLGCMTGEYPT
ncbi:MAG TPA: amidophosphoribosyltransferase [Pseudomonadota bacterium]|nr:amidophosphoribosyltransferase [Pseudomonadota bacterium]